MAISMRLTKEEEELARSYAKLHAMSLTDAFKRALFEKIEDEIDYAIYEEAHARWVADGCKTHPIQELWEELDAENEQI